MSKEFQSRIVLGNVHVLSHNTDRPWTVEAAGAGLVQTECRGW